MTTLNTTKNVKIITTEERDTDLSQAVRILRTAMNATDTSGEDFELWEVKDKIQEILDNVVGYAMVDYNLDMPCGEVRIISNDHINELWTETLIEQIKDCYDLSELPHFISIDWKATAETCKQDGMGHHFAGYDGEEHSEGDFHIFRTN